jgi:hypothetical protein
MNTTKNLFDSLMEKYELELLDSEKTLLMYFRKSINIEITDEFLTEVDECLKKFYEIIVKAEKLKEFIKYNNIESQ